MVNIRGSESKTNEGLKPESCEGSKERRLTVTLEGKCWEKEDTFHFAASGASGITPFWLELEYDEGLAEIGGDLMPDVPAGQSEMGGVSYDNHCYACGEVAEAKFEFEFPVPRSGGQRVRFALEKSSKTDAVRILEMEPEKRDLFLQIFGKLIEN